MKMEHNNMNLDDGIPTLSFYEYKLCDGYINTDLNYYDDEGALVFYKYGQSLECYPIAKMTNASVKFYIYNRILDTYLYDNMHLEPSKTNHHLISHLIICIEVIASELIKLSETYGCETEQEEDELLKKIFMKYAEGFKV